MSLLNNGMKMSKRASVGFSYLALQESLGATVRYKLDEVSGITAADSIGARDGTYTPNSGGVWTGGTLGGTGPITGSQAADFNGTTGYVTAADDDAFSPTNLTVEVWAKVQNLPPASTGNRMWIITKGASSNYEYDFCINDQLGFFGKWIFARYGHLSGSSVKIRASSSSVVTGLWTQVVFTVAGYNYPDCYVNGSLDNGSTRIAGTGAGGINGTAPFQIAKRADGIQNIFDGDLALVTIYPSVLTASNIADLYSTATG